MILLKPENSHIGCSKQFTFNHAVLDTPRMVELHFHDSYEIFWFVDGNAVYSVEGILYELEKDDIVITNMRELHAPIFRGKERYERKIITIKPPFLSAFITDDFTPYAVFENRRLGQGNLIKASAAKSHGIHDIFLKVEGVSELIRPEQIALAKAYLIEMLVKMSQIIENGEVDYSENKKVSEIIKYINNNLPNDLSVENLGRMFYMNKFYLSHLFKRQTGFSIGDYIIHKRIFKAQELITENVSLSHIPEQVGFSDYSNFYRSFKRTTGLSPREFLKFSKT